jgi:CCR4-NOT transcriptional regulation complex NOT5 subunit
MRVGIMLLLACPWFADGIEPAPLPPSLAHVRRIYIERLGGGQTSDQMRDMIIAALQNSKLFVITDNEERADATLRGSADDKIFTEEHNLSESIGLHANGGGGGSSSSSMGGSTSSHQNSGAGITDSETSRIQERRHEASASIRLVDTDGDVIWSTTQESSGGKFRGAMADVADKIARQLVDDTRKVRTVRQ